ncbi:hypothetical protein QQF64_033315 [Cirrhinus molitorella]|uniref:Uncharacterized protein n=2 Tax=Cirrhinus molitorella TaxID=172907 RepID=A0ABR3MTM9_9TELE|nr:hypothetical protein Q8A67_006890 [Cirrhinus molitorella]
MLDAQHKGQKALVHLVEIGCRGFVATSTIRLGTPSQTLHQTINEQAVTKEHCSHWLWICVRTPVGPQDEDEVIFYEDRNFQGRSYECMGDCGDFSSYMSRCHSCRVESGCWMMYDRPNYMGNQYFFRRGDYADYMSMFGMNECIRSCRMIPMYRGSYRMRIYERENFMGQMYEMMDDCDSTMDRYRMSHCQSCHIMDGHWLFYEQPHYRGRMWYFRPGEYRSFSNMGGMRFMSMRRIMDSWY